MINSSISKRQEDQRKHSFLEKKNTAWKGKWIQYDHPEISHHLRDRAMKQSTRQFHKIFSYLKMFSMQCRKNSTVEDNKKRMNIANFLNIYTNIYTYITCDENDSKWKWFNKLNTAAWSCCWQKWLCSISYFRISIFDPVSQTVQMEGSYHLLSYKD